MIADWFDSSPHAFSLHTFALLLCLAIFVFDSAGQVILISRMSLKRVFNRSAGFVP